MNPIELYQQIAEAYHAQGKYQERDRFLVLALDAASSAGHSVLAEQIRTRLLELNPNHLIKPYLNCAVALQSPNFITYAAQLRKNFPPPVAQSLLNELGGPIITRRKSTLLTDSPPMAEPLADQPSSSWAHLADDMRTKPLLGSNSGTIPKLPEARQMAASDPLANVPMSLQPPVPFKLEKQERKPTPNSRPPIGSARAQSANQYTAENAGGAWIGNLLFVILFLAGVATLAYIFVLPFYPEVAKTLKG